MRYFAVYKQCLLIFLPSLTWNRAKRCLVVLGIHLCFALLNSRVVLKGSQGKSRCASALLDEKGEKNLLLSVWCFCYMLCIYHRMIWIRRDLWTSYKYRHGRYSHMADKYKDIHIETFYFFCFSYLEELLFSPY